ncbi:ATP-binding cassette domain-containing protein [Leucobacter rhizosphaerae]|uniref:ATP-binding cassette domain-containing protein n=1 Tax=Leucobacter rhizosphaerae TaxID=2932245 RepID=A0ABY4FT45_9MICO|nr:ATP-binding cassette domain-containing protein [Leucobacter rhizosphaerae]UOQ59430.1 ATP-binding cassette domain-containing protein [Leucobacter rhizosphaerae]
MITHGAHGGLPAERREPHATTEPHHAQVEPDRAQQVQDHAQQVQDHAPTAPTVPLVPATPSTSDGAADTVDGTDLLVLDQVSVEASWGHIFGPVSFTVPRGGVTVLVGHGGRGRTALLLTLAGRMKPSSGSLTSFGNTDDPHALFRRAGVGFITEVDEIVQAIRVRDIVTEQLRWNEKWFKWVAPAQQKDLERMCRPVFGDLELPDIDAMVEELPELTAALFRIAAANARKPELLVVGGVDLLASDTASAQLLERLVALGETQTIITADVNGRRTDAAVKEYIDVPNLTNHQFAELEREETRDEAPGATQVHA